MAVRRALLFSFAQRGYGFALQLLTAVVLARLLTPAETGIFSLAAALVMLAQLIRDFGTSEYIITQAEVTREKMRAAFTATLLVAALIAAALLLLAGPVARWYQEPGVERVLHVLSVNFALLPFGAISFALLSRQLQFKRIFWIQSAAATVGAAVTLVLASRGASYMSMAYGGVASTLTGMIAVIALGERAFSFVPSFRGLRQVLGFGGAVTFARLLEQAAMRSSDVFVSAALGFHAGGLLSKTNGLLGTFHDVFNTAVARVATPAFAQSRNRPEETRDQYLRATAIVVVAQWLFFPTLGVFAHEIVYILFGARWMECVILVQLGAAASMLWAPYMLSLPLLMAAGAVRDVLRMQLIWAPLLALSFFVGAQFGLVAVIVCSTMTGPVRFFLVDRALAKHCGIRFRPTVKQLVPAFQVAASAVVVGLLARWGLVAMQAPVLVVLVLGLAAMLGAGLAAAVVVKHPLLDELRRVRSGLQAAFTR